jgi:hypothetical protein
MIRKPARLTDGATADDRYFSLLRGRHLLVMENRVPHGVYWMRNIDKS